MNQTTSTVGKPVVDIEQAFVFGGSLWGYPKNYPQEHVHPEAEHGISGVKLIRTSTIVSIQHDLVETLRTIYNVLSWDESMFPRPNDTHPLH